MENSYAMSTQFHWSRKRQKAALALAEGQSQQAVADAIGVCRKTIANLSKRETSARFGPRTATAVALVDSQVMVLDREI